MSRRSPEWLLIEIFGHEPEPTIIGRGNTAKNFVPLDSVIKSARHRAVISTALDSIRNGNPTPHEFTQGDTRYILLPLRDHAGHTQAVLVHYGDSDIPVKAPPLCGAWFFNPTTGEASGSSELSDIYRTPENQRPISRPMHEVFQRLVGNDPIATRKLIEKQPGVTHQDTETVRCDDGTLSVIHYSCRFVEDQDGQVLLHGLTREAGAYEPGSGAPNPFDLAHQVTAAACQPDVYRAVVDPTTGTLIRSYDLYFDNIRNISEILADQDEIDMIMSLLIICARDRAPLHNLVTVATAGRTADVDLIPMNVDGSTAVAAIFRIPPE